MVCSPSCYWILRSNSTKGMERLLAMTTTAALRLQHLYFCSSSSDEVDDEFGKLVHPKEWLMDHIRQNQFGALSFPKVTSANTLPLAWLHSVEKYLKKL